MEVQQALQELENKQPPAALDADGLRQWEEEQVRGELWPIMKEEMRLQVDAQMRQKLHQLKAGYTFSPSQSYSCIEWQDLFSLSSKCASYWY